MVARTHQGGGCSSDGGQGERKAPGIKCPVRNGP